MANLHTTAPDPTVHTTTLAEQPWPAANFRVSCTCGYVCDVTSPASDHVIAEVEARKHAETHHPLAAVNLFDRL